MREKERGWARRREVERNLLEAGRILYLEVEEMLERVVIKGAM